MPRWLSTSERAEAIDALTIRYAVGEISEPVFTASLKFHCRPDDIKYLVMLHRRAHRNSLPYKRGDIA